jgi:MFS family permease
MTGQVNESRERMGWLDSWRWAFRDPVLRLVLIVTAFAGLIVGLAVPFLSLVAYQRGASYAIVGAMASSYLITQAVLLFPAGALSDRVGRIGPLIVGLLLEGSATLAFAFVKLPVLFVALRVVQGVGLALTYPAARALIVDTTASEHRGRAFAAFQGAFNLGWLLGPAIGGVLASVVGITPLLVVGGSSEIALALTGLLFFRRLPVVRQFVVRRAAPKETVTSRHVGLSSLFTLPLLGAFLLAFGYQVPYGLFSGIWSIYLKQLGASDFELGLSFTTYAVANLLALPIGGRLADRVPRWRRLLPLSWLLGLVIVGYAIPAVPAILVLGAIEGALGALIVPSVDAYLASVSDPRVQGRVQGAYTTIGVAGAALSALFSSVLYQAGRIVPFATGGLVLALLSTLAVPLIRLGERQREQGAVLVSDEAPLIRR